MVELLRSYRRVGTFVKLYQGQSSQPGCHSTKPNTIDQHPLPASVLHNTGYVGELSYTCQYNYCGRLPPATEPSGSQFKKGAQNGLLKQNGRDGQNRRKDR